MNHPSSPSTDRGAQLHLQITVERDRWEELFEFLRQAVPYYESLDGVTVRLLQNRDDPEQFLEVIEYRDRPTYHADQERVETDETMRSLVNRWRQLMKGPPRVVAYNDVTTRISGDGA